MIIKPLELNNTDVWTGKTDTERIVDKINEIILEVKEVVRLLTTGDK